jgi:hypothetical protein
VVLEVGHNQRNRNGCVDEQLRTVSADPQRAQVVA